MMCDGTPCPCNLEENVDDGEQAKKRRDDRNGAIAALCILGPPMAAGITWVMYDSSAATIVVLGGWLVALIVAVIGTARR